jgi:hypothetical protein
MNCSLEMSAPPSIFGEVHECRSPAGFAARNVG